MKDIREIKREIRLLRKIKKNTHKKSPERRDLNKRIRELKKKLLPIYVEVSKEKEELIQAILQIRPEYKGLHIDLRKYTEKQLEKHLENIKKKGKLI